MNCSRRQVTDLELEDVTRRAAEGVNWEKVVRGAGYHRVLPLVYTTLNRLPEEAVPAEAMERLTGWMMKHRTYMMTLTAELLRVTAAMEKEGVSAVSLKGPALAASVYDNVAMRPSGDLDILVKPSEVPTALHALSQCGFRIELDEESGCVPSANQLEAVRRFHYHYILQNVESGLVVELHFRLFAGKLKWGSSTEEAFSSLAICRVGGKDIRVLNDRENLIYLCLHGGKHAWSRMEWIATMAELLKRLGEFDEEELLSKARKRGAEPALLLGIVLAAEFFDARNAPMLLRKGYASPLICGLSRRVAELLDESLGSGDTDVQPGRFQLELCGDWRRKLYLVLRRKLNPNRADVAAADWGRALRFLYYLGPIRRLLRMAGERKQG